MEYESPTNELMERLISKLTPEGRKILEEFERVGDALVSGRISQEQAEAASAEVLGRLGSMPPSDQELIPQVLGLQIQAHQALANEGAADGAYLERSKEVISRAQEIESAEGKAPRRDMTLGQAVEVLRRHGELA